VGPSQSRRSWPPALVKALLLSKWLLELCHILRQLADVLSLSGDRNLQLIDLRMQCLDSIGYLLLLRPLLVLKGCLKENRVLATVAEKLTIAAFLHRGCIRSMMRPLHRVYAPAIALCSDTCTDTEVP
jgi:hypothetical protein